MPIVKVPLVDRTKALGHTERAVTVTMPSTFMATPATGIVVVTITILPL